MRVRFLLKNELVIMNNLIPKFALHLNRSKHEQASQLSLQGKMSHPARNFSSG